MAVRPPPEYAPTVASGSQNTSTFADRRTTQDRDHVYYIMETGSVNTQLEGSPSGDNPDAADVRTPPRALGVCISA